MVRFGQGSAAADFRPVPLPPAQHDSFTAASANQPAPKKPQNPPAPKPDIGWKTIQPDLFSPVRIEDAKNGALQRFVVIGDAGNGLTPQFQIADQMLKTYQQKPFASVLVLGDNVYENGEPWKFDNVIEKPYKPLMNAGVRFYPVMGNHDVRSGFGPQQMAYWGAPQFYSRRMGNIEFFGIDTTVFLPGYDGCYKTTPFLALQQAAVQLAWLDKALADSPAKYKIVYGHYPIYSSGLHGNKEDATVKLRQILEPVMAKNHVTAYLAGHEHHYEKSKPIQGIQHFVSGAAGQLRQDVHYQANPPYPRESLIAKYHFMLFEETPQGLKYEVISRGGKTLESGLVPPNAPKVAQLRFA